MKRGILAFLLFLASALAQVAPTASLVGTVSDASGATVPGAAVVTTNIGTQFSKSTTTTTDGKFSFTLVPVGQYSLRVTAAGFSAY